MPSMLLGVGLNAGAFMLLAAPRSDDQARELASARLLEQDAVEGGASAG